MYKWDIGDLVDFTFDESVVLPLQEGGVIFYRNKLTSRVRNFHFLNVWFSSFDMLMVDFFSYRESYVCLCCCSSQSLDGKRSEMSLGSFSSFFRFFESSFWVSTLTQGFVHYISDLQAHIFDFGSVFVKKKKRKNQRMRKQNKCILHFTSWYINQCKYKNVSFNHFL